MKLQQSNCMLTAAAAAGAAVWVAPVEVPSPDSLPQEHLTAYPFTSAPCVATIASVAAFLESNL